jgi:hypothetical protein
MRKLSFFFLLIISLYSCKPVVKRLGANPKVSYYLVGRLKTMEVTNSLPFEIKVFDLNPQLIEKPIGFKILDEEKFSVTYSLNNINGERKEYLFGKEINDKNMHLLVTKTDLLDSANCESLKMMDYQFQVKGEE